LSPLLIATHIFASKRVDQKVGSNFYNPEKLTKTMDCVDFMARPDGETSEELFEVLSDWEEVLKHLPSAQKGGPKP